jgi:hypothetical protein
MFLYTVYGLHAMLLITDESQGSLIANLMRVYSLAGEP